MTHNPREQVIHTGPYKGRWVQLAFEMVCDTRLHRAGPRGGRAQANTTQAKSTTRDKKPRLTQLEF